MLTSYKNISVRIVKHYLPFFVAMHLLILGACSRNKVSTVISVEDQLPVAVRKQYTQALRHYSLETSMVQRLTTAANLHQDSTWHVADLEWPMFVLLLPADSEPSLKDCRSIVPGMIAVPRILNGQAFFELVPIENGNTSYTTMPFGRNLLRP